MKKIILYLVIFTLSLLNGAVAILGSIEFVDKLPDYSSAVEVIIFYIICIWTCFIAIVGNYFLVGLALRYHFKQRDLFHSNEGLAVLKYYKKCLDYDLEEYD